MMRISIEKVVAARSFFATSVAIALLLWIYAVLTTSIDRIWMSPMPIVSVYRLMPIAFWVGWGLVLAATVAWYFSPRTENAHYLLLFLWFLFLAAGPEAMQIYRRGSDTLGHMWGVTGYDHGLYRNPYVTYSAFPGFHLFVIPLGKITGVGYFELAKLAALAMHLVRIPAIWFLATRLCSGRKQTLFFILLVTALFWDKVQFDPSNQNIGLTFVLFILAFFFLREAWTVGQRLLVILLFFATVVTHPLSAFLIVILLAFFSLLGLSRRELGLNHGAKEGTVLVLFGVMFAAWLLYSSDWVLPTALHYFIRLFTEETQARASAGSVFTTSGELTVSPFAYLTWASLGLLLFWGLAIASKREFWAQLSPRRILPSLCLIPLFASVLTGFWTLERYYLLSVPFMAWFFTQERARRNLLAIIMLVIFFPYHFTLRYYNEPMDYPPSVEYVASRFIVDSIPPSVVVVQGVRYGPGFQSLANATAGPIRGEYVIVSENGLRPVEHFQYVVTSTWNREHTIFYWGNELWERANRYIFARPTSVIYANGDHQVYIY